MPHISNKGISWAVVTAVISGFSIFLNKFASSAVTPPLFFTGLKNLTVGFMLILLVVITRKARLIRGITIKELIYLLAIGVIGGSLPFYLFFTGLSQISAVNAAIIHKTLFLWVALFAYPLLKEKLSKKQIFAAFLVMSGNLIIGGFEKFSYSRGELMVLGATILWAIENILAKKVLAKIDPDIVSLFRMGIGSLILCAVLFIDMLKVGQASFLLKENQIFWLLVTSVLLLAYVLSWYRALKYSPAVNVTAILTISTLITNFLSAVILTHSWNYALTLQSILIFFGVLIFIKTDKKSLTKDQLVVGQNS
ncbi:MAG: hypothetical protein KatS3mg101_0661 [Patescibacteria group bacterium]|nr:MAG: hypothetical protein KatS3mg101_0661 [Patescibacteria group bacterium]